MAYLGRVSAADVAKMVDYDTTLDIETPIDIANELVTEVCASKTKVVDGVTVPYHSDAKLKQIELLLACHFYCLNDPRARRERVGVLTFEAQSKVDLGLNVTHYGQNAIVIDTSGALAALNKGTTDGKVLERFACKLKWLGDPCLSGPAYDNR